MGDEGGAGVDLVAAPTVGTRVTRKGALGQGAAGLMNRGRHSGGNAVPPEVELLQRRGREVYPGRVPAGAGGVPERRLKVARMEDAFAAEDKRRGRDVTGDASDRSSDS